MKDVLQEICAYKRIEVAAQKEAVPFSQLDKEVEQLIVRQDALRSKGIATDEETGMPTARFSMRESLAASASGIISEFKRKSPSKGWIKEEGKPEIIPPSYEKNGASALSILTDEKYFGGSMKFLKTARKLVNIPILRKDFIIDEYQLYQARLIGADAVLLIAADLTKEECRQFAYTAHQLQLETLLEVHSEPELEYVGDCIDMVGVNNRNLGTFHTDVQNSFKLSALLPQDMLRVSESGISNPDTVNELRKAGFRGFLIGENFMKTEDPGKALADFIAKIK